MALRSAFRSCARSQSPVSDSRGEPGFPSGNHVTGRVDSKNGRFGSALESSGGEASPKTALPESPQKVTAREAAVVRAPTG